MAAAVLGSQKVTLLIGNAAKYDLIKASLGNTSRLLSGVSELWRVFATGKVLKAATKISGN
jgi:hypothetical protein